jgi:hypothetical protein
VVRRIDHGSKNPHPSYFLTKVKLKSMKPFKDKFVICANIGNDAEIIDFGEDNKGNRIPSFYDTKDEAKEEILDYRKAVLSSIKKGWMSPDSKVEDSDAFIANATLDQKGILKVHRTDKKGVTEIIYNGKLRTLIVNCNS